MKRILIILAFIIFSATQLAAQDVKVFPNPATNVINLLGLKNDKNAVITVRDSYGNQVIFHQWDIKRNSLNIPVFNLEKGLYMITIQSEHQNIKTKFYKQ
ncbi:Por secretion system C-terminal sorting domain-containing protein [Maribacter dokdonensis]|uniref:Por secretion system C-terminal sorting domain-containing protein n=1 Tax=Maribacter dokdonensis TaxID=320912 RepID=A0ABY0USV0_9FLAO|nr:T9SS type A sorting domain-containing protein [Maribacter dokdonensis]SDT12453.1 Por secretion system C-terminal sorting domain-containing protein [Maribacter dokdonensis]